jgi:hypothetical protein
MSEQIVFYYYAFDPALKLGIFLLIFILFSSYLTRT